MAKTRGDLLTTSTGKIVGKQQLYALLVDAAGVAILDAGGNEQVIEVNASADGKIQVDASLKGSYANRRGLAVNKPAANAVDVGTTYWSVDTDPHANAIEVSDGTNWVVM